MGNDGEYHWICFVYWMSRGQRRQGRTRMSAQGQKEEEDISLSACHILLVEDNELNREIAKMIRRYEEERDKGVLILFSFTNAER